MTHVLLNIYAQELTVRFSNQSLTYQVLITVHGCCPTIHVVAVELHVVQLKLYAVACNQTHVSAALAILIVQILHSYHQLFANVNVGMVTSYRYIFAVQVHRLREVSFTRKLMLIQVVKLSQVL